MRAAGAQLLQVGLEASTHFSMRVVGVLLDVVQHGCWPSSDQIVRDDGADVLAAHDTQQVARVVAG